MDVTVMPALLGYRAAAPYIFRAELADAIIRTTSYYRKDYVRAAISFAPHEHAGVRQSIAEPFPRNSESGLGSLDRLPLELLHDVFLRLDLRSIFNFRQANLRARQMVGSTMQYPLVVSNAMDLICTLLRTHLAANTSLFDLFSTMCIKNCAICGDFSGFVFVPTWTRCCFRCIQEAEELEVKTLAQIRKQFHLAKGKMDQLASFRTLPGIYSMDERRYESRTAVASVQQALLVSGADPAVRPRQANIRRNQKFTFMSSCGLPYYDRQTFKAQHGVSCAGCQLALEKGIIGTRGETWAFQIRNKLYEQDGFLEHFRWCEQAQLLWESSGEGSKKPPELPEAARRRGYFGAEESRRCDSCSSLNML